MFTNPIRSLINSARSIRSTVLSKLGVRAALESDAIMGIATGRHFSRNEGRLTPDAYAVKHKLGKAFFRKRINPATRRARISSLTLDERRTAYNQGWIAR